MNHIISKEVNNQLFELFQKFGINGYDVLTKDEILEGVINLL